MTPKEKYAVFCTKTYIPIFSQPWWLDAAVGAESWDIWLYEKGGRVMAAMPYYHTMRNGHKVITKAPNTQNNGIIFCYPENQKQNARRGFEEACIEAACDYIEGLGLDLYEQQFHYSFTNWLPFFWRYYQAITRYTYVIDTARDLTEIETAFSSKMRNQIRKAAKIVHLANKEPDPESFYRINRLSFERQGMETPYSLGFVKSIHAACKAHDACKILAAEDDEGQIYSAALLVWDDRSVYYLLNGTDPQYKSSQANDFLIYEGIKLARSMGRAFDFEGSVIRPIEHAFREFGGEAKPYFRIRKVFDPDIIRAEAEEQIQRLRAEKGKTASCNSVT